MNTSSSTHSHQCPSMETWAAYVDGSLGAFEKADIAPHLESCEHCFLEVVSLRQALTAAAGDSINQTTPTELLNRARALRLAPKRHIPSYVYSVAAVFALVLTGLWISTRKSASPLAEIADAPLASLRIALKTSPLILEPPEESALGFAVVLSPEQAAFTAGLALANLKIALLSPSDPQIGMARLYAHQLQEALQTLGGDTLPQPISEFFSNLHDAAPDLNILSHRFSQAREAIDVLIHTQGDRAAIYLYYGEWHQGLRLAIVFTRRYSLPLPSVLNLTQNAEYAHLFSSRLKAVQANVSFGQDLDRLATLLSGDPSVDSVRDILDSTTP